MQDFCHTIFNLTDLSIYNLQNMYMEYVYRIYNLSTKKRDKKLAANLVHCRVQKIDNHRKSFTI